MEEASQGRFEWFVRTTFPGMDAGGRLLLLQLLALAAVFGAGSGLIHEGLSDQHGAIALRVAFVGGGTAILTFEAVFVVAYALVLLRMLRSEMTRSSTTPTRGRHASP